MKWKDNPEARKVCYSGACRVVETGFHLNSIYVCKTCKLELSETLYNKIKDRQDKEEEAKQLDLWDEH